MSTKLSLIAILAFILFSCGKDEKLFIPDQDYSIDQTLLLRQIIELPKKYKISLTTESYYFSAPNGVHIEIPALALKNEAGQPVTGDVIMTFDDLALTKSQLLYAPSSIYNGKMFESKKMLHLDFSQHGKSLTVAIPIHVIIPAATNSTDESLIWLDGIQEEDSEAVWIVRNAESNPLTIKQHNVGPIENQVSVQGYKVLFEQHTKWISIVKFEEHNTNVPVITCLTVDQALNHKNSVVYFISSAGRSSFQLHNTGKNEWSICTHELVPNELSQGSFVVISDLGNQYYHFGMTNAVLGKDANVVIKSESKTNKEIKEILSSL